LPVVAEQLSVGTREVDVGGVRVTSTVQEVPVNEQVQLREERVEVERRPANRPIAPGDEAFREKAFEVKAVSEEPVIGKEARVVEEVVVRKDENVRTQAIRDTVRRENVNVENLDERREDYAPAYEYGRSLRQNRAYGNRAWDDIEPDARADWERRSPGTWERFKGAVRRAWEDVKS
jgi:uncharacterized protein (TIGR02271 family)